MASATEDTEEPITQTAYAERIGKSRAYVSKLVTTGVIHGPAFTIDRRIIASVADQQRADVASHRSLPQGAPSPGTNGITLLQARLLLTTEQAAKAALENKARRAELIERDALAIALPPLARRYADAIAQVVRDTVADDEEREALLDRIHRATTEFIAEALTHGGADQSEAA